MNISLTRAVLVLAIAFTPFSALTPPQTNQVQRTPQFENENVTVWKTVVPPNAPLTIIRTNIRESSSRCRAGP